jgi:hypothetical protein
MKERYARTEAERGRRRGIDAGLANDGSSDGTHAAGTGVAA